VRTADKPIALVVDDNEANRLVLELMLESAGITTFTAASGAEALAHLCESRVDLVVTDIRMPGLDGFGLLAAIRAMPETRDLPVVAISADLISNSAEAYLAQGFTDFVPKPMLVQDMHACMARLGFARAWAAAA
jgi:Response regulator containing CheY-like receiver, AAA-type ATPase, and DNA-binding domains